MAFYFSFFRFAAILLLLSAAVDLIAVDMLGALWQDHATVQTELQGSCAQDDCFCCSPTTVPVKHVVFAPTLTVTATDPLPTVPVPFVPADPLFRPPRA